MIRTETFIEIANNAYQAEIEDILYEENGQRKLIFINPDISSAFNDITNSSLENAEYIKRGIARGFAKAFIAVIEAFLSERHNLSLDKKKSEQIFYGQFNEKKGKVHLWLEIVIFYIIADKDAAFSFKVNLDNQSINTEENLAKLMKSIEKSLNKQIAER